MSLDRLKRLLYEGLADVKNKYFKDMDDKVFNELVKLDPTYKGGDQAGNYTRWILNLYNKGKLKEEDFYKVTEYLDKFNKIKKKMKNKDIFQFKSLPDIAKALDEFGDDEELTDRQELRRLKKQIAKTKETIHEEAELVHDGEDWEVWIPKTFEASCALGKETHWCTASPSSPHYFNSYTEEGPLYILINKKDPEDKYQLHFETDSFMNRYDDDINLYELFTDNVELRNFFLPKIEEIFNEGKTEGVEKLYFLLPNPTEEQTRHFIGMLDSSMHMDENGTIYYEDDIKDVLETIKGEDRRGDYLSVDFIYDVLTGEGWQDFDYSPDFNSRDAKLEMQGIDGIDNLLNELGFTLDDLEEAWDGDSEAEEKLDSLGMDDIARNEIENYYQDASRFGAEQEAVNDIQKDLANYFPYDIDYDKGKMKIYFDMNKIEDLFNSVLIYSYDDYEGFISSYLDYYENGGVKLNEPRYGWYGFDKEYFKSEVEALLKRLIRDKAKRDEVVESPGQQKLM